jgi:23S rRNA (adenine2030-N6)-methyltransferase
MNYRHAYHAGNFADVVKHATLSMIIAHLKLKPAPFRVIDTHAGIGRYDLGASAAEKTGEWRLGIGRLLADPLPEAIATMLAPYLAAVLAENPGCQLERVGRDGLSVYPGSPMIARHLLREQDALVVNELHPEDHEALTQAFARDRQTKVMAIDGWTTLKAVLPPKERRGVILIDPPFEEAGELIRLITALGDAHRRFATGTYVLWYPIKDQRPVFAFKRQMVELGLPKLLEVELLIRRPCGGEYLIGCGMIVLNPPFSLKPKLDVLLPFLADRLGLEAGSVGSTRWLVPEQVAAS